MTSMVLTNQQSKTTHWALDALQVIFASLILGLSGQICLLLPFSPVPLALPPSLAVMLGMVMGPKKGTAAVALYLLEGAMGLPFFSNGHCGLLWLMGPTGGYLFGYLLGAGVGGLIAHRWHGALGWWTAAFAGQLAIFAIGLPQLALYVGWQRVLLFGFYPFILGDVLKAFLLTYGVSSYKHLKHRFVG